MFDLATYINGVSGASVISRADELLRPRSDEVLSDVTMLVRQKYASLLDKGWKWVFEHAEEAQPNLYRALNRANPSLVVAMEPIEDPLSGGVIYQSALFLMGDGLLFRVEPGIDSFELTIDNDPENGWVRLYRSLPDNIARAYYLRANGMDLTASEFYLSHAMRGLPGSLTASVSVVGYLPMPRKEKAECEYVLSSVADTATDGGAKKFRVLLDTREHGDDSLTGDLLIYQAFSDTKAVFHVPGMDFKKIRRLVDAAGALDRYVSNVLTPGSETFDFTSYGEKP